MAKIVAIVGGKQKGLADQVSIDLALGCKNQCVGCYAKKSSQRGKNYDNVVSKDMDKEVLKRSLRKVIAEGFQLGRVGKHCDPGDHLDSLNSVLDCCNDEHFRCVCVSKSLEFNQRTADLLRSGNHILHMSLGPFSPIVKGEMYRVNTAQAYRSRGVRTAVRLTRDITQEMSELDQHVTSIMEYIVTPMRYSSREIMNYYKSNEESFEYVSGYYRPKEVHPSWMTHMLNVCGEINNEIKCCNCLAI